MAEQQSETDKSEAATPFKLDRARKKGNVARGADIGFFAMLIALGMFAQLFGRDAVFDLSTTMRKAMVAGVAGAPDQTATIALAARLAELAIWPLITVGIFVSILVIFANIVQLRGLIFTFEPLRPDFARLNPAKGLKRLFSLRMLKEAAKNIVKVGIYCAATYFLLRYLVHDAAVAAAQGPLLAATLVDAAVRLLIMFMVLAAIFAVVDQVLVRREFAKQMRMSRRELTREYREREGEPRQRQKRKQLHADYVKQQTQIAQVPGSDVLVVNPEHYAVALIYDANAMTAPHIRAKGRNAFALQMRVAARRAGVTIVENAPLARQLYKQGRLDTAIPEASYSAIADIYIMLRRNTLAGAQNAQ
jgi:flagellar biosynthesis protein FlhB